MTPISHLPPSPISLATLPCDLLFEIASWLHLRSDVLHLGQASKHVFVSVAPCLYETVVLVGVEQCTQTLEMLFRHSQAARHVRKLIVRTGTHGSVVSSTIRKVAVRLDALNTFEWDGEEMPEEDIWFALRMLCPRLRRIATTIGADLPKQNSHLFDFVDLLGFSITLKPSFYNGDVDLFQDAQFFICQKFWDMLEKHSPNLEEFSIEGSFPHPINAFQIANARWRNLRKLNIGDIRIESLPNAVEPTTTKAPFIAFLEAHPKLQSVKFSRHTIHPSHFSHLGPETLPCVTEFSGTLEQLQQLPHTHPRLKSVTFLDPIRSRPVTTSTMAAVLQSLPALVNLRVSFALHSMYDSTSFLRSLIAACPRLESLELTCSDVPSFQLDTFSKNIRKFTRLRRLKLALVRFPGDEALSSGAIRIARSNPRLSSFKLIYLPPSPPLHLSFRLPFFPVPACMAGRYKVICDEHGLPMSLVAHEKRRVIWPWGLGVWQSSKSSTVDLRPAGHPTRKRGIGGLVLERSPSGDEIRMMVFYLFLVALALWGFMARDTVVCCLDA